MGKFTRVSKDRAGNVAMIFGLSVSVLALVGASAVELTRINSAKAELNSAADAAALAAKKIQMESRELGAEAAFAAGAAGGQKTFFDNTDDVRALADNVAATFNWDSDESSRVFATADVKMLFGGIIGMNKVTISATAVASSGGDSFYEIAMVLDNTGSMFETDGRPKTRFTHLREASTSFVNAAFDNMGMPDRLRFAVVPFATSVNIKSEEPGGWNPAAGSSGTVPDYGSRSMPSSTLNRNGEIVESTTTLNNMFAPAGWRGCVAGTGESMSADDQPKSGMKWNALHVPSNLHQAQWRPTTTINDTCEDCSMLPPPPPGPPSPPPGPPPPPPPPPKGMDAHWQPRTGPAHPLFAQLTPGKSQQEARFMSFMGPTQKVATPGCTQYACVKTVCDMTYTPTAEPKCAVGQDTIKYYGEGAYSPGRRNTYFPQATVCVDDADPWVCQTPKPVGNQQPCVSDPNELVWNGTGGAACPHLPVPTWTSLQPSVGPNINCPMPMLGLSGSRPQVLATINRMSPVVGGTHNDVGLRWGLRALSPRVQWANFFGNNGSKRPVNFGGPASKKAMVLITDGENTQAIDYPGFWGCAESGSPGCSGAPDAATLDTRMLAWCEAIREDYDVELYTVAVNITNPAAVSKLATCAGDPSRAFAVDAAELNKTLETVARSIFALRIKE